MGRAAHSNRRSNVDLEGREEERRQGGAPVASREKERIRAL